MNKEKTDTHYHVQNWDNLHGVVLKDEKIEQGPKAPANNDVTSFSLVWDEISCQRKGLDSDLYKNITAWKTVESCEWKNTVDTVAQFKDVSIYSYKCDCIDKYNEFAV